MPDPPFADPQVSGEDADPNGNGLPNWAEYAIAADPKASSSAGHPAAVPSADPEMAAEFSYVRRLGSTGTPASSVAADIAYEVEQSADLNEWEDMPEIDGIVRTAQIDPHPDGLWETVRIKHVRHLSPRSLFLRLKLRRLAAP